eukprot:2848547-Prymnesium_polylepis.1
MTPCIPSLAAEAAGATSGSGHEAVSAAAEAAAFADLRRDAGRHTSPTGQGHAGLAPMHRVSPRTQGRVHRRCGKGGHRQDRVYEGDGGGCDQARRCPPHRQ